MKRRPVFLLATALFLAAAASPAADVFTMPAIHPRHQRLVAELQRAIRARDYESVETIARAGAALLPEDPTWRYNLACALSVQLKTDEALEVLERAIRLGFTDASQISKDTDFASIRANPRFAELLDLAGTVARNPPSGAPRPSSIGAKSEAWVGPSNTVWNFQLAAFDTYFAFQTNSLPAVTNPVVRVKGPAGDAVRGWFDEGTAAGNRFDLYDNHDRNHSHPDRHDFPWLAWTRYSKDANARNVDTGAEHTFFFHGPRCVIGNSSTATVNGPYWRSNGRTLLTTPPKMSTIALAYFRNQLYVYPAVRDFSAEEGDLIPANTPYFLVSKGASWSDKPFLQAFFLSLAAMRPETKQYLSSKGLIAPTLQWALRHGQKCVDPDDPETYMSPAAHPAVFDGSSIDALRMVNLCHGLSTNSLPPIAFIEVVEEPQPRRPDPPDPANPVKRPPTFGPDFIDHWGPEVLFTTPQAVARLARGTAYSRRMVVDASKSQELGGKPLKWHWRVLGGDPGKTRITPLDEDGSRAEIIFEYQGRSPIAPGSDISGCRADVGVFADNGEYISAPAFISLCFPANEIRAYSPDGRIISIDGENGAKTYADPALFPARKWIDIFHYDSEKNLTGWTRTRGTRSEHFTRDGMLIETTDELGRPLAARGVIFRPAATAQGEAPELVQSITPHRWIFAYDSDEDSTGHIASRETVEEPKAE